MPEMIMCKNKKCVLRKHCYRFMAIPKNYSGGQSYEYFKPSKVGIFKWDCDNFVGMSKDYKFNIK